jgi:hypothetical protein
VALHVSGAETPTWRDDVDLNGIYELISAVSGLIAAVTGIMALRPSKATSGEEPDPGEKVEQ